MIGIIISILAGLVFLGAIAILVYAYFSSRPILIAIPNTASKMKVRFCGTAMTNWTELPALLAVIDAAAKRLSLTYSSYEGSQHLHDFVLEIYGLNDVLRNDFYPSGYSRNGLPVTSYSVTRSYFLGAVKEEVCMTRQDATTLLREVATGTFPVLLGLGRRISDPTWEAVASTMIDDYGKARKASKPT